MEGDKQKTERKRKRTEDQVVLEHPTKHQHVSPHSLHNVDGENSSNLDLSLSLTSCNNIIPKSNQSGLVIPDLIISEESSDQPNLIIREQSIEPIIIESVEPSLPPPGRPQRARRNPQQPRPEKQKRVIKSKIIEPPYPWARDRRGTVHTLRYLIENNITKISGQVQCKKCNTIYEMDYDLEDKFREVAAIVIDQQDEWHDRALDQWTKHWKNYLTCRFCGTKESCKPVLSEKKRSINWLFLFLGQTIGCCSLEQLKYFCKHIGIHRTGAKNRVLCYAYVALCQQLDPNGPYYVKNI
ncbi:uncharacterized protein LOC110698911 [Chenopodium quinoa]|uniref:uncharacterized protein LOC110698911 n=1 Tax=Chenopodium quinoa TaxID=63459 RepID=UPI000B7806AA|nr:uncharacterized protein LOC110698911 [Chenopodium quinoa]